MKSSLLILSCSKSKDDSEGLLPAIKRYTGPYYKVVRRYLADNSANNLSTRIFSGRFGLIPADYPIPAYDEMMTVTKAKDLSPGINKTFREILRDIRPGEIFVNLGSSYLPAMSSYLAELPPSIVVTIASGSIGARCSQLYAWLRRDALDTSEIDSQPANIGHASLRGVNINKSPKEVLSIAMERMSDSHEKSTRWHTRYVQLGTVRVSPKWLTSILTDLPVTKFRTQDAIRFLNGLGIEVHRL